jgi:carboxymethylenebutenolidase
VDQRIVDLYDEFTHKPLARRVFMERLVLLTGSVAAAEIALSGLQPNYAYAAVVSENDPRIVTSRVEVAGVRAYQASPRNVTPEASRNVVIVIHAFSPSRPTC